MVRWWSNGCIPFIFLPIRLRRLLNPTIPGPSHERMFSTSKVRAKRVSARVRPSPQRCSGVGCKSGNSPSRAACSHSECSNLFAAALDDNNLGRRKSACNDFHSEANVWWRERSIGPISEASNRDSNSALEASEEWITRSGSIVGSRTWSCNCWNNHSGNCPGGICSKVNPKSMATPP